MLAKDIMTRKVISATPAMSVRNAALLMLANGISGLPVVDDEGAVCGILTEGDLIRRIRREINRLGHCCCHDDHGYHNVPPSVKAILSSPVV